jgi:hypothetical protein
MLYRVLADSNFFAYECVCLDHVCVARIKYKRKEKIILQRGSCMLRDH